MIGDQTMPREEALQAGTEACEQIETIQFYAEHHGYDRVITDLADAADTLRKAFCDLHDIPR